MYILSICINPASAIVSTLSNASLTEILDVLAGTLATALTKGGSNNTLSFCPVPYTISLTPVASITFNTTLSFSMYALEISDGKSGFNVTVSLVSGSPSYTTTIIPSSLTLLITPEYSIEPSSSSISLVIPSLSTYLSFAISFSLSSTSLALFPLIVPTLTLSVGFRSNVPKSSNTSYASILFITPSNSSDLTSGLPAIFKIRCTPDGS